MPWKNIPVNPIIDLDEIGVIIYNPPMSTQILTYKYPLMPTKRQHASLAEMCEAQRVLYNAALEERIDCYRKQDAGAAIRISADH